LINAGRPRIPNPINPAEDFADKWDTVEGRRLKLEENFRRWVAQARVDFIKLAASTDPDFITEQAHARFRAPVNVADLRRRLGLGFPSVVVAPKTVPISEPARPWRR
jgi:hypothetical protein